MKTFVLPFKKINKNSVIQAGGKGANLGELTHTKAPVPPGFVVLADAFDEFLSDQDLHTEINATLKKVKVNDINTVDRASHIIKDVISRAAIPKSIQTAIAQEHQKLGAKWSGVICPDTNASPNPQPASCRLIYAYATFGNWARHFLSQLTFGAYALDS